MIHNVEKGLSLPRSLAFLSLLGAVMMLIIVAYTLAVFIHDGGVGGMPVESISNTSGDNWNLLLPQRLSHFLFDPG
ncbi:hypothetical protein [Rhodohalobacter barkolensis]|uniref:hypothetical protein n=1 Tax=Rhodohalobacter barkolensis TaxID=2053187 RepID=UPI00105634F6|nr:hypothetical protein [Rhodohalobacter barkolensis]